MGKTQNTGRLTNGIFQDSSNNIAIGDSTASGYKFKVTGTSNLNGALSGTSASFNATLKTKGLSNYDGVIEADNSTTTGGGIFRIKQNGVTSGIISVRGSLLGNSDRNIGYAAEAGLGHYFYVNDGTLALTIASTGAAIFSSSVGVGGTPNSWASSYAVTQYKGGFVGTSASSFMYYGQNAYNDGGFKYVSNGFAGIYAQDTGDHIFYTAPSGTAGNAITFTPRMTITSGGNVGIGITPYANSISKSLDLVGGAGMFGYGDANYLTGNTYFDGGWKAKNAGIGSIINVGDNIIFSISNSGSAGGSITMTERMRITSGGNVLIATSTENSYGGYATLQLGASTSGSIINFQGGATSTSSAAHIRLDNSGSTVSSLTIETRNQSGTSSTPIVFKTQESERMRITSGGQVQIKQSANTYSDGLSLTNSASATWKIVVGGDTNLYLGYGASADRGQFSSSTGVYTPLSDINKKKDFEDSTIGLNAILGLKPTLYRMTDEDNTEKHLGFIAQEVKDFIPQAYVESGVENKFIGLNYNAIVATLVKAVQEQQAQIEELKALIAAK